MTAAAQLFHDYKEAVGRVIVGQADAVKLLAISLFTEGHVLLEGVPGTAKTTLVRTFARAMDLIFKRIQFTPDLMPTDILGTQIFDFQKGEFRTVYGPVFTNILLADEINRAPAKTQAALLECMQERQVSIEGAPRKLPDPFIVLATENPVEQEGTYPLPEAELDRFFFKIMIDYPSEEEETEILRRHRADNAHLTGLLDTVPAVCSAETLKQAKEEIMTISLRDEVIEYIVTLVRSTRTHPHINLGGSPRAALLLETAAKAEAALSGREFVIPDDVKAMFEPVLHHRMKLTASAEVEGVTVSSVLAEINNAVPVPR